MPHDNDQNQPLTEHAKETPLAQTNPDDAAAIAADCSRTIIKAVMGSNTPDPDRGTVDDSHHKKGEAPQINAAYEAYIDQYDADRKEMQEGVGACTSAIAGIAAKNFLGKDGHGGRIEIPVGMLAEKFAGVAMPQDSSLELRVGQDPLDQINRADPRQHEAKIEGVGLMYQMKF